MPIKQSYHEITGSKYTCIQLEIPCNCNLNDINTFLCSDFCESAQKINNPHQSAYFAFLVNSMRDGVQGLKGKKDSPVQLNYGIYNDTFMISISFLSDNAMFRLVSKMIAEKCFQKNLKPAHQMLSIVDKEFYKQHKDKLDQSMHFIQKQLDVVVMSKMASKAFNIFGNKVLLAKLQDYQQKIELPSSNPIPFKGMQFDQESYNNSQGTLTHMDDVLWSLLQSCLNGQGIDYINQRNKLFIRRKAMLPSTKEQCYKYIKERLKFTDSTKAKKFTPEIKKKMSLDEFKEKQNFAYQKKILALSQVLLQSGAVPHDQIKSYYTHIKNFDIDKHLGHITKIKSVLADLAKLR